MVNLKTIEERLAKAREEAEFWEQARALLADPRMEQLLGEIAVSPPPTPPLTNNIRAPRPYGELKHRVLEMLPDEGSESPVTTKEIVRNLTARGYVFEAKDPEMAVNAALVSLQEGELALNAGDNGKRGKAKLWTKKSRGEQAIAPSVEGN